MADHVDAWATNGKKNLFGQPVKLVEMQASPKRGRPVAHALWRPAPQTSTYTSPGACC